MQMLVASSSSLRDTATKSDDNPETIESAGMDEFSDCFSAGSLLDSIDFDELFAGLDGDPDALPDLEILGDYSISGGTGDDRGQTSDDGNDAVSGSASGSPFRSGSGLDAGSVCSPGEGVVDKAGDMDVKKDGPEGHFGKVKKSAASAGKAGRSKARGSDGNRKVKVDWTPELHKRFVQAVEQLGEKAVPSRILEIMGTEGLTRHNIASHLQKYRSHRKHLIAREAEAASWNQRRHMYGGARGGGMGKRVAVSPWLLPTIGFPPAMSAGPVHHHHPTVRPLHVWGHPSGDPSQTNTMWPKHILPHQLRPPHLQPRPVWAPPHLPYGQSQGMPCYPPPPQRFMAPPVPGIPHHAMYKTDPRAAAAGPATILHPPLDSSPSNESIDAALEDVLAKPWLPLPIGLKSPAIDTVVGELQRQGVPQIPPS